MGEVHEGHRAVADDAQPVLGAIAMEHALVVAAIVADPLPEPGLQQDAADRVALVRRHIDRGQGGRGTNEGIRVGAGVPVQPAREVGIAP